MAQITTVGVIGAGKFGTTVSSLISKNADVLLYTRKPNRVQSINQDHKNGDISLPDNIEATSSLERLAKECTLILPIVPSMNFRDMMKSISPLLTPEHILIHGTKGLDVKNRSKDYDYKDKIQLNHIMTMSEVIRDESSVIRIGCLSGPNIATEILAGQPTATVVASGFNEVIHLGRQVLESEKFFVFGSNSLKGAEMAGALKNYIALGAGLLEGHGMGRNMQALLMTRGLREMIHISKLLGSDVESFLGTAGIGDLFATSTSKDSRNFIAGTRLAKGESIEDIVQSSDEIAEGIRTLSIANQLSDEINTTAPITKLLYSVIFGDYPFERAIQSIMRYPFTSDVDFL